MKILSNSNIHIQIKRKNKHFKLTQTKKNHLKYMRYSALTVWVDRPSVSRRYRNI